MKLFKLLLGSALLVGSVSTAFAAPTSIDNIPVQCQKLFDEADMLVSDAAKQPGTHPNLAQIRAKLNASKAQILKLERATQIKSCGLGLAKLNRMTRDSEDLLN